VSVISNVKSRSVYHTVRRSLRDRAVKPAYRKVAYCRVAQSGRESGSGEVVWKAWLYVGMALCGSFRRGGWAYQLMANY